MNVLGYLQKIGRALMVPVAVLPAAALLMGIGYWIDPDGWGGGNSLAALLIKAGAAIIDQMPILFAVGVSYGMSKDKDGAAALAGLVAFLVLTTLCSPGAVEQIMGWTKESGKLTAFNKISNQFVGILCGVIASELYNRFSSVELPKALSFFSGRRLVPILVSFVMIVVAFAMMFIWPPIYNGLVAFGEGISGLGAFGAGVYAFFNRLLIPIGLHHALNSVFWFDVAGINDIPNYLNGTGVLGKTGMYQAGFFPIMMFGLPAAAFAIYKNAKAANKAKTYSIMLAAAFASFFTGITEPLEFSFMFVAPMLYGIHAVLTGISVMISAAFEWIAGFGFSAGLVDYVLDIPRPLSKNIFMLIPQGLVFAVIYYFVFDFAINKFNLMTPGREDEAVAATAAPTSNLSKSEVASKYIDAIGGVGNIQEIDNCITRLRLKVNDSDLVDEAVAKSLGATGVIKLDKNTVQIIVGMGVEKVADAMRAIFNK